MYEAIEHWKQYKLKKNKQKKFNHYFPIVVDIVYISGFVAVFSFTIFTLIIR